MKRRILLGSLMAVGVFAAVMAVDNRYFDRRAWDRLRDF